MVIIMEYGYINFKNGVCNTNHNNIDMCVGSSIDSNSMHDYTNYLNNINRVQNFDMLYLPQNYTLVMNWGGGE